MKFNRLFFTLILLLPILCFAQPKSAAAEKSQMERPKLVVGIVIDQMRWDYLYRYFNRYTSGGFKRLINQGFSCENTLINYLPSYTAVGHSTIFTGSIPALHGIAGNNWTDQLTGKQFYCTDDSTVQSVGSPSPDGKMSPRNLLTSTITDELRLATNFKSKVIGVSLKDRASILPAGHLGQAYWLDDESANFITSTYYQDSLPKWLIDFNSKKRVAALINNGWNTLYPINTYTQSDADNQPWEGSFPGETVPVFPHDLKKIYATRKSSFRQTPFGNTITLELAKTALLANQLGKDSVTDFLTINCASTDYVGHQFGPNAIEVEDTYLRLDKDLETFFKVLDSTVGKGQWLVFLSADHGAAHSIGFMQEHKLPADFWYEKPLADTLNKILQTKYGSANIIRSIMNYQVNFDLGKVDSIKADYDAIKKTVVDFLQRQPGISFAVDIAAVGKAPIPEPLKTMITNGYNFKRSGGVQIVLNPGWIETYSKSGTTHGTWNPYDTHIPLLWYGWGIKKGHTNREVYMTDIAATLAGLLHIQMPNGCVGKVIGEVAK
jgi:predicted AlkP superfamily pyrophosphatase or phosphodiesterase